jgi:hypothetical protein
MSTRSDYLERFSRKIDKSTGCWLWTGAINPKGYAKMRFEGRAVDAHRVSWNLHRGSIPDGLFVLHRCDVRHCVNPEHLFLGTHQDNMDDMQAKGRHRCNPTTGERHWSRLRPKDFHESRAGERNGRAKLSAADVIRIRESFRAGDTTVAELAREFGIGWSQTKRIIDGEVWKDVA